MGDETLISDIPLLVYVHKTRKRKLGTTTRRTDGFCGKDKTAQSRCYGQRINRREFGKFGIVSTWKNEHARLVKIAISLVRISA